MLFGVFFVLALHAGVLLGQSCPVEDKGTGTCMDEGVCRMLGRAWADELFDTTCTTGVCCATGVINCTKPPNNDGVCQSDTLASCKNPVGGFCPGPSEVLCCDAPTPSPTPQPPPPTPKPTPVPKTSLPRPPSSTYKQPTIATTMKLPGFTLPQDSASSAVPTTVVSPTTATKFTTHSASAKTNSLTADTNGRSTSFSHRVHATTNKVNEPQTSVSPSSFFEDPLFLPIAIGAAVLLVCIGVMVLVRSATPQSFHLTDLQLLARRKKKRRRHTDKRSNVDSDITMAPLNRAGYDRPDLPDNEGDQTAYVALPPEDAAAVIYNELPTTAYVANSGKKPEIIYDNNIDIGERVDSQSDDGDGDDNDDHDDHDDQQHNSNNNDDDAPTNAADRKPIKYIELEPEVEIKYTELGAAPLPDKSKSPKFI